MHPSGEGSGEADGALGPRMSQGLSGGLAAFPLHIPILFRIDRHARSSVVTEGSLEQWNKARVGR